MKLSVIAKKSALARGGIVASCERILSELKVEIDPRILKELRAPRGKGATKIANELDAMQRFVGAVEIALCGPVPMPEPVAPIGGEDIMDLGGGDTDPILPGEIDDVPFDDAPDTIEEPVAHTPADDAPARKKKK